ncbi:hypothetical protein ACWOFO_11495 [Carnobacterium maltaromaticum]|uniref:hypothetical protein n=1 Tax=Carnobacterium maltaromaticum TaxID=2751 RepID=UPI0039AF3ECD
MRVSRDNLTEEIAKWKIEQLFSKEHIISKKVYNFLPGIPGACITVTNEKLELQLRFSFTMHHKIQQSSYIEINQITVNNPKSEHQDFAKFFLTKLAFFCTQYYINEIHLSHDLFEKKTSSNQKDSEDKELNFLFSNTLFIENIQIVFK